VGPEYLDKRYLIAVSGGVDSMTLAYLMKQVIPNSQLAVAHFDHRVRKASRGDAHFVKEYALKEGFEFTQGRREGEGVSEAALRKERLEFLKKGRRQNKCDYILTAHHADDQLETFFMRLLRGAGIEGLAVMNAKNGVFLKPMLGISKAEIIRYAKDQKISYREDVTNKDDHYFRNRVRHSLLPVFERLMEEYGGKREFHRRFWNTVKEIQGIALAQKRMGRQLFEKHVTATPYWLRLDRKKFAALTATTQRLLLREGIRALGVEMLSRVNLERLRKKAALGSATSFRGFNLSCSCGFLYLQNPEMANRQPRLAGPVVVDARVISGSCLRLFEPGDRIKGKKLKKIFLKHRIPKLERAHVPVIAKKGTSEVLWFYPMKPEPGIQVGPIEFPFSFQG
jgi:tRNA(Ile)-lysidine synthetase-like protein